GEGSPTYSVKQTDQAGNQSATAASYTWTVDTTAPSAPSITASPSNPSNTAAPSFSFTGEASATFQCQLDSGGYSSCTAPKSYSGLAEGSHTFSVKQTDQAGNQSATTASYTWTVDTTAPDTSITSSPSDPSSSSAPSFSFDSTESGSSFVCELDGAGFS